MTLKFWVFFEGGGVGWVALVKFKRFQLPNKLWIEISEDLQVGEISHKSVKSNLLQKFITSTAAYWSEILKMEDIIKSISDGLEGGVRKADVYKQDALKSSQV